MELTPHTAQQPGGHIPSDGFHGDHELDNLGQQLSIHSPGKTTLGSADHDQEHARRDISQSGSGTEQLDQAPASLPLTPDMQVQPDLKESEQVQYGPHQQRSEGQEQSESHPGPPFSEQLTKVNGWMRQRLEVGDPWYLINQQWFVNFKRYCSRMARGEDSLHPGEIDNSILLDETESLRRDVQQTVVTINQEGWDQLVAW